jgi:CDP-glycerol glycerophosphotransferase
MSFDLKRIGPGHIPGLNRVSSMVKSIHSDIVLFDSWHGQYSDNPRAISEELSRRKAPFQQVWAGTDPMPDFPDDVIVVKRDTWAHLGYLNQARYIFTSNGLPSYFRKRRGCTYVQTWHGTPLKRIAFDVENPTAEGRRYRRMLKQEVESWDFLISQNSFSTNILPQAFRYHGRVLETGYPRNDLLSAPAATETRSRTRRKLGIDDDACTVLYAPTWRDGSAFSLELDLTGIANALGGGHVILLRAHQLVASTVDLQGHNLIHNVSDYPDIRELYLAADVLITDYSSVMFDFAVTRKPMLFFTYDIEHYRDELRGFYFDLEAQAPGPLVRSTAEVIEVLADLKEVSARYADAYDRFVSDFCPLDDGDASARVIDAVFDDRDR